MLLNESTNYVSNNTNIFMEGVAPLVEVSLLSEMAWNNILEETYKNEAVAIKNEDTILMEESDKNFLKKIKDWIKEKIKAIGVAFSKMATNIKGHLVTIGNYLEKIDVDSLPKSGVECKVRPWVKDTDFSKINATFARATIEIISTCSWTFSTDDIIENALSDVEKSESMINQYVELSNAEPEEMTGLNAYLCGVRLKKAKSFLEGMTSKSYKKQIDFLKKANASINAETKANALKLFKKACSALDSVISKAHSCMFKLISDCLKVVKAGKKSSN